MCDPVSYAALAIGSAYLGYEQQNAMADYQSELNDYNNKLSAQNYSENMNSVSYNQNQERDAAVEQLVRDDLDARKAEARARVAAGESGVAGQTVDSLMREIKANQALYASSINQNLHASQAEADSTRRGLWNTYVSEVANRPAAIGGSAAKLAIGIGMAGVQATNMYEEREFRKTQAAKGKG